VSRSFSIRRSLVFFVLLFCVEAKARLHTVTLLHFSDYHSHAAQLPRAIGYLRRERARGALVFSGGDMINKGSPSWSDKYQCAEWPWLNGIVDAMAFGNHDADYGRDAFERCRAQLRYPILSANTSGMQGTAVVRANGARIGVFAVAGPDFPSLVKAEGFTFGDRIAAAREAVRALREREHVDAVVMIGHEHIDDDAALARTVPGIDVIFGTHSHLERPLTRIDGTQTWFISPSQYLAFISRVVLTIDDGKVTRVDGGLVRVDDHLPLDQTTARRVARMQRELERDPKYAPLFQPIATLAQPMSVEQLAQRTLEVMRKAAHADVAVSTMSSFREPLPRGAVTLEALRNAMPYDNEIVVVEMTGDELRDLLGASGEQEPLVASEIGQQSTGNGQRFRVAVTDYLATVAARYRRFFASHDLVPTGLHVRDEVRISLAT
jgi:5'-nucleotidase/UDP-sugar diphosphatase